VQKFLDSLEKTQQIPKLLNQILELNTQIEWTTTHHDQLESIDTKFTKTLLAAEAQSSVPVGYSWSATLDNHSLIYNYWSIKIYSLRNNINSTQILNEIENKLPEHAVYQQLTTTNPVKQMRHARRNLINSRLQSDDLRDSHHTILHDKLINEGKISKAQAVQQQRNKERRRRCWRTFKILKSGSRSTGGITHVLKRSTTNFTSLERIQAQHQLDSTLLDRNISHFAQAHGTPFTTESLIEIIGDDGCSNQAFEILQGNVPEHLQKFPKLLLKELRQTRPTLPLDMTLDDMCHCFDKWRENTTTSPSGKHLGIYKALINARNYDISTT
jgi:hypothetical protein